MYSAKKEYQFTINDKGCCILESINKFVDIVWGGVEDDVGIRGNRSSVSPCDRNSGCMQYTLQLRSDHSK